YKLTLKNSGFKEQSFSFPAPHCHNYHDDNDKYEKSILDLRSTCQRKVRGSNTLHNEVIQAFRM
ncbi:MAG: hypothetical protein ACK5XQ_00410, partial [Flavobacteriales bacterium]